MTPDCGREWEHLAKEIGDMAEHWRRELASDWLGRELPKWSRPCPIITSVSQPIHWCGETLQVGASIGVAFPQEGKETILSAIGEADAALYEAKARGKGRVALSDSDD